MNTPASIKVFMFFILLPFIVVACQPITQTLQPTPEEVEIPSQPTNPNFEVFTSENITRLETISLLGAGQVHDVAVSPDQSKIAVYINNEIKIYDAEILNEITTIPAGKYDSGTDRHQNIIVFSLDGRTLISTNGQFIFVWDLQSNERINWFASLIPEWGVTNIEYSPNGERLLITTLGGSRRCDGRSLNYGLYDLSGNLLFDQYSCADYANNYYKFISDDKVYFLFSSIMTEKFPLRFYLVNLKEGKLLETSIFDYYAEPSTVQEILYDVSPSGNIFAYVVHGNDKPYTRIIDSVTREHIQTVEGYIKFFDDNGIDNWEEKSFTFQPLEENLISEKCRIKNLNAFEKIREIAINNNKIVLEVSRSSKFVYLELLDVDTCQTIKRIEYPSANKAIFSPDTRWLATTDGFNAYVWNLSSNSLQFSSIGVPFEFPKNIIQFNSDGTRFIVGTLGYENVGPDQPYRNYKIFVFNVETGDLIREIKPRTQFLSNLFATNDKNIIMAYDSYGFHFWNIETGEYLSTIPSGAFVFYPETSLIWVVPQKRGDPDLKSIFLFDYKTGEKVKEFSSINTQSVRGLYLSKDNEKLMAHLFLGQGKDKGNAVSVFDIRTGNKLTSYNLPWIGYEMSVYGDLFVTENVNGYIYLWNFDSDIPYSTFFGYRKNHKVKDSYDDSYEFSNWVSAELINEEILLVRSGGMYLWDIKNDILLTEISPNYRIVDFVVSPDQSLISVVGEDGLIRIWAVVKP